MPELFRTRDSVIFVKAETLTVSVDDSMVLNGWRGGQGVTFTPVTEDEVLVTLSDGLGGGFLLWGSDESSDQFTAVTENQPYYGFAVIGMGAWLIATSSFEQYTYASRNGPGPLVPIVYNGNDPLFFSLLGNFTSEDEWSLSLDSRAPNDNVVGFVVQAPRASPNGTLYLSIQVDI
jgi:dipeptidyl aminopeptidase/acylaminoacyl peptidase